AAKLASAQADYEKAKSGPRQQEKDEAEWAMKAAEARRERMNKGWRAEEITQAEDDWKAAEADLDYAKKNYERFKEAKDVSQNEYDNAHSRYMVALRRTGSARAKYTMLKEGNRAEDKADAEAAYRQAKAHYELLKEGTR